MRQKWSLEEMFPTASSKKTSKQLEPSTKRSKMMSEISKKDLNSATMISVSNAECKPNNFNN